MDRGLCLTNGSAEHNEPQIGLYMERGHRVHESSAKAAVQSAPLIRTGSDKDLPAAQMRVAAEVELLLNVVCGPQQGSQPQEEATVRVSPYDGVPRRLASGNDWGKRVSCSKAAMHCMAA